MDLVSPTEHIKSHTRGTTLTISSGVFVSHVYAHGFSHRGAVAYDLQRPFKTPGYVGPGRDTHLSGSRNGLHDRAKRACIGVGTRPVIMDMQT